MYASRRDSCIYTHYRSLLSEAYEKELVQRGIGSSILAYRRIPRLHAKGNKSNIHFAADAFNEISKMGDCVVYTLDVSKFFDTLDHSRLKRQWMQLMGFKTMPPDHYRVFRSITKFACVDREKLYWALGFIGVKSAGPSPRFGYKVKRVPMQVCRGNVFRSKISPLIKTNSEVFGIPQGSPMSDVLANLYMLDFDTEMSRQMSQLGGSYRRYSDDILVVVPGHSDDMSDRLNSIENLLSHRAGNLKIQSTISTVHKFSKESGTCERKCDLLQGTAGKNGLEYLGFRFDGRHVFIRDSTRSRLQRKMTFAVHAAVSRLHRANPGMGRAELKKLFNPDFVLNQFYKVREFESKAQTPNEWTFWSYVIRSQQVFGEGGRSIAHQVRSFRRNIAQKAERFINRCTNIA
jgi:Reverse transcriptase (RNA-dependent DNA polymerase)